MEECFVMLSSRLLLFLNSIEKYNEDSVMILHGTLPCPCSVSQAGSENIILWVPFLYIYHLCDLSINNSIKT
jgi:hypothetical protein